MIPPHVEPVLQQDGSIVRAPCWCDPCVVFVPAMNDLGETYVYPHTYHHYPLSMVYFCSLVGEDDDLRGPPI